MRSGKAGMAARMVLGALAICMAGCGGGGSSSTSEDPADPPPSVTPPPDVPGSNASVGVDKLLIQATATLDDQAPTASFTITLFFGSAESVHISGTLSQVGIASVSSKQLPGDQVQYSVQYKEPPALGAGVYQDVLTLKVCTENPCQNEVSGSPLTIQSRYEITAASDAPQGSLPILERITLSHNVVDAEYSRQRDELVMVATEPSNHLYVYSLATGETRSVLLNKAPTSVSLSPDGQRVAIGHDALISVIDLPGAGLADAAPATLLNVSTHVFDLVFDGNGSIHAFPLHDQWVSTHSVHIATNIERLGTGSLRAGSHARLHPSGDSIYAANNGLSPSDIEKWDITTGVATRLYDSPYHGQYGMCGNVWFNESGSRIFTRCGNTFNSSTQQASDMIYAGRLALASDSHTVVWLDHLQSRDELAVLETDESNCGQWGNPLNCHPRLGIFDGQFLEARAVHSLPRVVVNDTSYPQLGRFVFYSADGSRKLLLTELKGSPTPRSYLSLLE